MTCPWRTIVEIESRDGRYEVAKLWNRRRWGIYLITHEGMATRARAIAWFTSEEEARAFATALAEIARAPRYNWEARGYPRYPSEVTQ